MRHALVLAARRLGQVAPNPAVGCVIVSSDGRVIGRGWTQPGGRPHAETMALKEAGASARGATAYVTLEPCAHHGQTPPCADALIEAGIACAVIAGDDPDPRVAGRGIARLRKAGIEIRTHVLRDEAYRLNEGFFKRIEAGRPMVALKIAQSADGRVADAQGSSQWITSPPARSHGQMLRARFDAIMTGIGTVLADDPLLTCRLPGLETRSSLRVVIDTNLRLSPASQLARTARDVPVLVFTAAPENKALQAAGVTMHQVGTDADGHVDLAAVLNVLGARGITRVLVEGGPTLHAAFFNAGLADRIYLYRAPMLLGGDGLAAIAALREGGLDRAPRLERLSFHDLGADTVESFAVRV
jgi:diaminohydroxyphosphoribosylaminopyrimidine deaminase/5-amino-6-(5-phosphoribosylamino)uracil reductase